MRRIKRNEGMEYLISALVNVQKENETFKMKQKE